MKNCRNCGTELADDAMFCSHCGSRQDDLPETPGPAVSEQAPVPPPSMETPPAAGAQQSEYPQVPPYPYAYPPQPPKAPSAIALDGKRYFRWLLKGFLGTSEPIHLLFAAIVPFLISLFMTLEAARLMRWHAGGFFLLWFFTLIILVIMPVMAWVMKRYLLKEEDGLVQACSRFSSYLNMVLPVSLLALILGAVLPAGTFISVLMYVVPVLILMATVMTSVFGSAAEMPKVWLVALILTGIFFFLIFVYSAILGAGLQWGLRGMFRF